jgi:enoyl-CoA hydratase
VGAVKIGLSAGECGISYLLPRLVGASRAFEVMLTGRPIQATEAERIGLVSQVVADDELLLAAITLAEGIVANAPFAVWMTKELMWTNLDASSFEAALSIENRTQMLAFATNDREEAVRAFLEKRPPVFVGN